MAAARAEFDAEVTYLNTATFGLPQFTVASSDQGSGIRMSRRVRILMHDRRR